MSDFRLTVLVENDAGEGLFPEHGWSVLIETGDGCGLFDTGQTDVVVRNARVLGADLAGISWIVLSHGHYDHTGGLKAVLEIARSPVVFAHPDALLPKYVRDGDDTWREAGMSMSREEIEKAGASLRECRGAEEVVSGITVTGEVARRTGFETVNERFFVDRDGRRVVDGFPDDQALVLDTRKGPVVILGCSHAGVVNTLRHAAKMTGADGLHAVIGGMHLGGVSEERLAGTIDAFREYEVEKIGPVHCTGAAAVKEFGRVLGERCVPCPAGTVMEF